MYFQDLAIFSSLPEDVLSSKNVDKIIQILRRLQSRMLNDIKLNLDYLPNCITALLKN